MPDRRCRSFGSTASTDFRSATIRPIYSNSRRHHMRPRELGIGTALAIGAGIIIASAQTPAPTSVDGLVSAAKVAAGTDWSGTFTRLCIPPPAAPAGGRGRGAGANAGRTSPPPRETWHVEPAKVADNL